MSLHEKSSNHLHEIENHEQSVMFEGKNHMFWPTASALGLLYAESKNFIFVLQGQCDLHVKCCRRMQPDVTGFRKIRMSDLDGFKQCKLGLRYVNFAPIQAFFPVLRVWDIESWKTRRNQKLKATLATQVGHASGRKFTNQLQLQQAKILWI